VTSAVETLRGFLAARDDAEPAVGSSMRSYVLPGAGNDAVVLLHGLTASPPAWNAISAALNAAGSTVVAVRLPLHGHTDRMTRALSGLSADLLTSDLRAVIAAVAALEKRIVIGGHSLGGTLAIYAAGTLAQVDQIVAIAPFLGVARLPREAHRALLPLVRRLPNAYLWWDPIDRDRQQPEHGYPRYPLHALTVGIGIAEAAYAQATGKPYARVIDLVLNARESSVNNRAARRLAARWRRTQANVMIHELDGLPPSHDIIEPLRPNSQRVRDVLVDVFAGRRGGAGTIAHRV